MTQEDRRITAAIVLAGLTGAAVWNALGLTFSSFSWGIVVFCALAWATVVFQDNTPYHQ